MGWDLIGDDLNKLAGGNLRSVTEGVEVGRRHVIHLRGTAPKPAGSVPSGPTDELMLPRVPKLCRTVSSSAPLS